MIRTWQIQLSQAFLVSPGFGKPWTSNILPLLACNVYDDLLEYHVDVVGRCSVTPLVPLDSQRDWSDPVNKVVDDFSCC